MGFKVELNYVRAIVRIRNRTSSIHEIMRGDQANRIRIGKIYLAYWIIVGLLVTLFWPPSMMNGLLDADWFTGQV